MVELVDLLIGLAVRLVKFLFRAVAGTLKFLFTNLTGTILVALAGSFFVCGGCVGVATVEHESAPTTVNIADLETAGPPKQKWLTVTDGYAFWPLWIENTTQQVRRETSQGTTTETVEKERTEAHYVPVVSKAVLDEWMKEYQEKGTQAAYDYSKCRLVVKMSAKEFETTFPGVSTGGIDLARPYASVTVTGEARALRDESAEVLRALANHTRGAAWERMMKLEAGRQPLGKEGMASLVIFGLLWFIPLGVLLARRYAGKGGAVTGPKSFSQHGVSFQYPGDWNVTVTPHVGGLVGWKINFGAPTGVAYLDLFNAVAPDVADNVKEGMTSGLKEQEPNVEPEFSPSGAILAGHPAKGYEVRTMLVGKRHVGQIHAAVAGSRTVCLTWAAAEENRAKLDPGLNLIRNSLQA